MGRVHRWSKNSLTHHSRLSRLGTLNNVELCFNAYIPLLLLQLHICPTHSTMTISLSQHICFTINAPFLYCNANSYFLCFTPGHPSTADEVILTETCPAPWANFHFQNLGLCVYIPVRGVIMYMYVQILFCDFIALFLLLSQMTCACSTPEFNPALYMYVKFKELHVHVSCGVHIPYMYNVQCTCIVHLEGP